MQPNYVEFERDGLGKFNEDGEWIWLIIMANNGEAIDTNEADRAPELNEMVGET